MFRLNGPWPCLLLLAACSAGTEPPAATPDPCLADPQAAGCDPRGAPPVYEGGNVIDRVMTQIFWEHQVTPVAAERHELCRRLFIDLTGRAPGADQIEAECGEKSPEEIAKNLQASPAYLRKARRQWRDRFELNDVVTDWRYSKALFALVDELHQGRLRYDQFAIRALSHPGFVTTELQPVDRVRAAFRAFLGRPATDAEAADLAALTRPWTIGQEPDPDFPYAYRFTSYVIPALCQPLFRCSASLFGGGTLDLADLGFEAIRYEDLTAEQRARFDVFGRAISGQPMFWEAAADEILNRLLGWSDGGRFPREPGVLLPEVRQALAEQLLETGDYAAAERTVIGSWLYRQKAEQDPDGLGDDPTAPEPPVWASGPLKPMQAEDWLDSAFNLAYDFGTCDPRYPDFYAYFLLFDYARTASISADRLNEDIRRLHELQESEVPLYYDPMTGIEYPNLGYLQVARLIGGCPGFQAQRSSAEGIAYAFSQEALAELLCQTEVALGARPPGADPTLESIVVHQMRRLFGRSPEPEELAAFTEAERRCSPDECTTDGRVRSVCVALLGSAEGLFY